MLKDAGFQVPEINMKAYMKAQIVDAQFRFVLTSQYQIDAGMHSFQIGHHRTHHTSGKSAFQEQRRHMLVGRVHKITQKIVNELPASI